MRVILLGRKPVACAALRYMHSRGAEVVAVVTPGRDEPDFYPERLVDVAEALHIPVVSEQILYDDLEHEQSASRIDLREIDLVVVILHQRRIRRSLTQHGKIGGVNFHPAPLPEYRGWGTYNVAILENVQQWGASAHLLDEDFDTGPLIKVHHFDVDTSKETSLSLQLKTQPVLFALFKEVFEMALQEGVLSGVPQGPGRSFKKNEVMAKRSITADDSPEIVERKIRAFWYPPNPGAQVAIAGTRYTVINQTIFDEIAPLVCGQSWHEAEE